MSLQLVDIKISTTMNPVLTLVLALTALILPNTATKQICQAGEYQTSTAPEEVTCRRCHPGKFSTHPNNDRSCDDCKTCQQTQITVSDCTSTSDTVCGCRQGQRWKPIIGEEGLCVQKNEESPKENEIDVEYHKICPAGKFRDSSPTEQLTCRRCSPGKYSTHPNTDRSCDDCTICQQTQIIFSECTSTSDTLCGCPQGQRWKPLFGEQGRCVQVTDESPKVEVQNSTYTPCELCPAGSFQVKPCKGNCEFPTCLICSKGSYNSNPSNSPNCELCTTCGPTETELSACTTVADTICKKIDKPCSASDNSIYMPLVILVFVVKLF